MDGALGRVWSTLSRYRVALVKVAPLVLLLLGGCAVSDKRELYGVYEAVYSFGTDRIELRADGSYVQKTAIRGESPLIGSGSWTFVRNSAISADGTAVRLENYRPIVDGLGRLRKDYRTYGLDGASLLIVGRRHGFGAPVLGEEFPHLRLD